MRGSGLHWILSCIVLVLLSSCSLQNDTILLVYGDADATRYDQSNVGEREISRTLGRRGYTVDFLYNGGDDVGDVALPNYPIIVVAPGAGTMLPVILDALTSEQSVLFLGRSNNSHPALTNVNFLPDILDEKFIREVGTAASDSWLVYSASFLNENFTVEQIRDLLSHFPLDNIIDADNKAPFLPGGDGSEDGVDGDTSGTSIYLLLPPELLSAYVPLLKSTGTRMYASYLEDEFLLHGGFPLDPITIIEESLASWGGVNTPETEVFLPFKSRK